MNNKQIPKENEYNKLHALEMHQKKAYESYSISEQDRFAEEYLPWLRSLAYNFNRKTLVADELQLLKKGSEHRSETGKNIVHATIDKFEYFKTADSIIEMLTPFLIHKPKLLEEEDVEGFTPPQYLFASKVPAYFHKEIYAFMKECNKNCEYEHLFKSCITIEPKAYAVVVSSVKTSEASRTT